MILKAISHDPSRFAQCDSTAGQRLFVLCLFGTVNEEILFKLSFIFQKILLPLVIQNTHYNF